MANLEKLSTTPIICEGGLDSNRNFLLLSERTPGTASSLINFEPSLYGGYRRLNGFDELNNPAEVDAAGAEGKILGVAIFNNDIMTARKSQGTPNYKFYRWDNGLPWSDYATGLTLVSTGVDKIRNTSFNYDGTDNIIFVDGVNNPSLFDGLIWSSISPSNSGTNSSNAGGALALDNPRYVTVFKNHVFVAGDSQYPHIIAHSAPTAAYDWTAASGAGQIIAGFVIKQLKVFREELYVFGETDIKKIVVDGTTFVLKDVTSNIGCIASDSVVEINGDLLFLAQDGFRTIAGTERVGDVELGNQAKRIQQDILDLVGTTDLSQVNGLVVRKKSQVRFFFSDENLNTRSNLGIIGGIKTDGQGGSGWEWGRLLGIRTSCSESGYIGTDEFVIHGDYNGVVYRQEVGSSFGGENILAVYSTPYLDFGDPLIRKTFHKLQVFLRPEGDVQLSTALQFDWGSQDVLNPTTYVIQDNITGALYGTAEYGLAQYARGIMPVLESAIEGSGRSLRITFSSDDMNESYSIQALVFEYSVNGRK